MPPTTYHLPTCHTPPATLPLCSCQFSTSPGIVPPRLGFFGWGGGTSFGDIARHRPIWGPKLYARRLSEPLDLPRAGTETYLRAIALLAGLVLLSLALRGAMAWRVPGVSPDSVLYIQCQVAGCRRHSRRHGGHVDQHPPGHSDAPPPAGARLGARRACCGVC